VLVTNQTWAGAAPAESGWSRLPTGHKVGVILSGALVVCLAVLTLLGAVAGSDSGRPQDDPATQGTSRHGAPTRPSLR
jgi:hypothetical protein